VDCDSLFPAYLDTIFFGLATGHGDPGMPQPAATTPGDRHLRVRHGIPSEYVRFFEVVVYSTFV